MKNLNMKHLTSVLCLSVLFVGCSGSAGLMDAIMTSWDGSHIDEVTDQWGFPHEERNVDGRRLYVWREDVQTQQGTPGGTSRNGIPTPVISWECNRILELNEENIVVDSQWDGNNCPFMDSDNWGKN